MTLRLRIRRAFVPTGFFVCLLALAVGASCPSGATAPMNPTVPLANRPPRLIITGASTPESSPQAGDPVTIDFTASDAEDVCVVRIFASTAANPVPAQEIPILDGYTFGPGSVSDSTVWNTTGIADGTYYIFGEVDDRTYDMATGIGNRAVRVTYGSGLTFSPEGLKPQNSPPVLVFTDPTPNLGLSMGDEVTIRYIYADTDSSSVTVTLLLDKDQDPTNDDINNPGNPLNPSSKIIILPSTSRLPTDPTFDGDPPPPDTAANPPIQADSLEIRTNP
ncbi:MAG TPA: hypothetical protein VMV94_17230, partial [Phycisphaerae bacterium]|nr:hypothetical protein [Phycisphaerae bacterium]